MVIGPKDGRGWGGRGQPPGEDGGKRKKGRTKCCTSDAEYSEHAVLDSPEISKTQKYSRDGSPWLENQHQINKISYFFEPELMAAAVLVKTIVFDQFLIFLFFDFLGVGESGIRCGK